MNLSNMFERLDRGFEILKIFNEVKIVYVVRDKSEVKVETSSCDERIGQQETMSIRICANQIDSSSRNVEGYVVKLKFTEIAFDYSFFAS